MDELFGRYAEFYDTLYADKDYAAECDFALGLMRRHGRRQIRNVLDLGCGTGGHAQVLAARGFTVTGVDRSEPMLQQARVKVPRAEFVRGDVRTIRLDRRDFDAVIAMFAVVSYQTTPEDVQALFETARGHLAPGGVLVFDGWYGPGVLNDPPGDRVKKVDEGRIVRHASAVSHPERQLVEVHYAVRQGDREVEEVHPMRYLFPDEMRGLLEGAALKQVALCPFMKPGEPCTERDWLFTAVARAQGPDAKGAEA